MTSDQNSKQDSIALAIKKNPCNRCSARGFPNCRCAGSGDSGGGSESKDKYKETTHASNQTSSTTTQIEMAVLKKFDEAKINWVGLLLSNDKPINYEAGLFSIESDKLNGKLSFHIQPDLSPQEKEIARGVLKEIITAFKEFKDQLIEKGISLYNFSAELTDKGLTIQIPNPQHYKDFIKHLDNKNLLPIPNPERQANKESEKSAFNPTPLKTRLERE